MAQTVVLPDGKSLEFAVTERKPGASSEADPTSLGKRAAACRALLEHGRAQICQRWILAGHSMGGRVASEVASGDPDVLACIFFSYPLHPPGQQERLRDTPLVELHQPLLFVRGTRDNFCEEAHFKAVRARLASPRVEVHTVDGGDHGLKARGGKAAAAEALVQARAAAVRFARDVAAGSDGGDQAAGAEPGAEPGTSGSAHEHKQEGDGPAAAGERAGGEAAERDDGREAGQPAGKRKRAAGAGAAAAAPPDKEEEGQAASGAQKRSAAGGAAGAAGAGRGRASGKPARGKAQAARGKAAKSAAAGAPQPKRARPSGRAAAG